MRQRGGGGLPDRVPPRVPGPPPGGTRTPPGGGGGGYLTGYPLSSKVALLPPAYVVRREGNSFTLFVCPHLGGVPISHNALQHFPECHEAAGGGGGTWPGTPPGGVPDWVPPRGGTWLGTPPGTRTPPRGYPDPPGGVPDRVPPPGGYPGRTTEGVLTTRRAVCLLRSRRRTFLS